MNTVIFESVKSALGSRLAEVTETLLPGGKIVGREYVCASLAGGQGKSCRINLENGVAAISPLAKPVLILLIWRQKSGMCALMKLLQNWPVNMALWIKAVFQILPMTTIQKMSSLRLFLFLQAPRSQCVAIPIMGHAQGYGVIWAYRENYCSAQRALDTQSGKVVLPQVYGSVAKTYQKWVWKALADNRPLYGLNKLQTMPNAPVLLVEGEKTADAAQNILPDYAVLSWSGGCKAVRKFDFSPLKNRIIIIWPDNDWPGFDAALDLCETLEKLAANIKVVLPDKSLPEAWDLADDPPADFNIHKCLQEALPPAIFRQKATGGNIELSAPQTQEAEEFDIKAWPKFSFEACPGILGDFVNLATRDSEADPAAVCITALVGFCAEVYGTAPNKGPHVLVGETVHPPRLFAVICGNSSKARKGTSRYPVTKLFSRALCTPEELRELKSPARESGGPLSTGEGLAFHVRDLSDSELGRLQKENSVQIIPAKGDKRLIIIDEEFASGLACTKREGNTLSMGIRCFWDSGDYSPLTKSNPVTVKGAHINIVTHITMQELAVCLAEVQAFNGFGNRFLWICARRSKLVALPQPMPDNELAPIQRELWRIIAKAQKSGAIGMTSQCLDYWKSIYPDLSREHTGLVGNIINRAEAQTIRLALVYALLDGQDSINETHLRAALAMWKYAEESAYYIFGDKTADPLEVKILEALKNGPLTATELSALLCRNIPKERLQPLLQQMEARQVIAARKQKGCGRPRQIIALNAQTTTRFCRQLQL